MIDRGSHGYQNTNNLARSHLRNISHRCAIRYGLPRPSFPRSPMFPFFSSLACKTKLFHTHICSNYTSSASRTTRSSANFPMARITIQLPKKVILITLMIFCRKECSNPMGGFQRRSLSRSCTWWSIDHVSSQFLGSYI